MIMLYKIYNAFTHRWMDIGPCRHTWVAPFDYVSVHTAITKIVVLAKYLLRDYLYYANFMNAVLENVLGADTWVNFSKNSRSKFIQ